MSSKKQKRNKDEEKAMCKEISKIFSDILDITGLTNYYYSVVYAPNGGSDKTFSVEVNDPYRMITLYVRKGGLDYWKEKAFDTISSILLHEAFHVFHWKYKEMAHKRYISEEQLIEEEENLADKFGLIITKLLDTKKQNRIK